MRLEIPVIGVMGRKKSGKTTVIEKVVRELTGKGYRVATAKHISQKSFSLDDEGKDTWKHARAGANPVISVSDVEIGVLIKDGIENFHLDNLFPLVSGADVLLLEGFSQLFLSDKRVDKVICVRNENEYEEFKKKARGEIIAFCSFQELEKPVLKIEENSNVLVDQILRFIERKVDILKILGSLPKLDCKKCGYQSCDEMATAIYEGKAKMNDCVLLKLKPKLKAEIKIGDEELPIQPFVSEIIRKSILGMISSLKGVSIRGDERVRVEISS